MMQSSSFKIVGIGSSSSDVHHRSEYEGRLGVRADSAFSTATNADLARSFTRGLDNPLTGHAASFQSISDAASAAWAAPGVTEVEDKLTVSF